MLLLTTIALIHMACVHTGLRQPCSQQCAGVIRPRRPTAADDQLGATRQQCDQGQQDISQPSEQANEDNV
jgi:hypothetical protein